MCLRTKMRIAKRADRPIYCYKLLSFDRGRNLFTSPVTNTAYRREETIYESRFQAALPVTESPWANVIYGFHSYMGLDCIRVHGMKLDLDDPETPGLLYGVTGTVVAKCVIPYGAMYWEGNSMGVGSDVYDQYCSDRIELVAYLEPEPGKTEWKRPGRAYNERSKPAAHILNGLDITEARERLGRWYVLESQHVDRDSGVYLFTRVGTYGRVELHTWRNKVMWVN